MIASTALVTVMTGLKEHLSCQLNLIQEADCACAFYLSGDWLISFHICQYQSCIAKPEHAAAAYLILIANCHSTIA